jgi:hypothetical protein
MVHHAQFIELSLRWVGDGADHSARFLHRVQKGYSIRCAIIKSRTIDFAYINTHL